MANDIQTDDDKIMSLSTVATLAPVTADRKVGTDLETSIPKPSMSEDEVASMSTVATLAPITLVRRVRDDLESFIPKPYMARGLCAPDTEHPYGSPGHNKHENLSVLQQHCAFFDQDDNGIIYPWETYTGLRQIGFNVITSLMFAFLFNVTFSYISLPGWIPSPFFPIYLYNIHKCKHGSDTGTYDTEGRFVPVHFENIFSKYAVTRQDKLSLWEVWSMTEGNRRAFDPFGWLASKGEWMVFYMMAHDDEGYLSKEACRGLFDGTLFQYCASLNMGRKYREKRE